MELTSVATPVLWAGFVLFILAMLALDLFVLVLRDGVHPGHLRYSGPRAMFFLLADLNTRFRLLKCGLALVLVFVGAKMLTADFYKVPIGLALGIAALILGSLVTASLIATRKGQGHDRKTP